MVILIGIVYLVVFYLGAFLGNYLYELYGKSRTSKKLCQCDTKQTRKIEKIPLIGYIVTLGKCKNCGKQKTMRKFLTEYFVGVFFMVLFVLFLGKEQKDSILISTLYCIHIAVLMIIAVYDKKSKEIKKSALSWGIIAETIYLVYVMLVFNQTIIPKIFYYMILFFLILFDTILLRKRGKSNYAIQVLMLSMYLVIFTGEVIFVLTVIFTLLAIAMDIILRHLIKRKYVKEEKKESRLKDIGFYLCITNIIVFVALNAINYIII